MALAVVAKSGSPDMRKGIKAVLHWTEAAGWFVESSLLLRS